MTRCSRATAPACRRAAPADLHRPRRSGEPAVPDPGRGHLLDRHPHRGRRAGRHGRADGGPHGLRHRPPPVHHPQLRRDHGPRPRPASSSAAPTRSCWRRRASTTSCTPAPSSSTDPGRPHAGPGAALLAMRRSSKPHAHAAAADVAPYPAPVCARRVKRLRKCRMRTMFWG